MSGTLNALIAASLITAPIPPTPPGPIERAIAVHAAEFAAGLAPSPKDLQAGVELRWAELGPVLSGQRVTAVLRDGRRVTGHAVVVRDDALVIDVTRTTGSRDDARGQAPVPRAEIATIELERHEGGGRTLGVVLGVLTGIVIGGWVSGEAADSAGVGIPVFLGVAASFTLAGYYAGKQVSRKVTVIRIVD